MLLMVWHSVMAAPTHQCLPAHDSLNGLSQHLPAVVQVSGQGSRVDLQLADTPQGRGVGQQGVANANTQVAQHSGVCVGRGTHKTSAASYQTAAQEI